MFKNDVNTYQKIEDIIISIGCTGLYITDEIPSYKLDNALNTYADSNDMPIAILDATVFGSAKNGMAFTIKGIYWKNDYEKKEFLSWDVLSKQLAEIKVDGFHSVSLPKGGKFDLSGCQMKKSEFIDLIDEIVYLHDNVTASELFENQETYSHLISEVLAILIVLEDEIDNVKVELATEIINVDDFIDNKQLALENLLLNIEKYFEDRKKSEAFLKLRLTTLNIKIKKIINNSINDSIKDKLNMTLDIMLEAKKDGDSKMEEIVNEIKINL
jgi:hypothetical protein